MNFDHPHSTVTTQIKPKMFNRRPNDPILHRPFVNFSIRFEAGGAFLSTPSESVQNFPSLYKIWYYRLGHPHYEVLKSVIELFNHNLPDKMLSDFVLPVVWGFTSTATYNN
jgi:hypothetical protein